MNNHLPSGWMVKESTTSSTDLNSASSNDLSQRQKKSTTSTTFDRSSVTDNVSGTTLPLEDINIDDTGTSPKTKGRQ